MPGSGRRLWQYLGSIVQAVTERGPDDREDQTPLRCRRRPGRKRCNGRILAMIPDEDPMTIHWFCPVCEDNGVITGWQGTLWDRRRFI
ncbi:hypothetical protein GF406_02865 [candidate division KSB1 bacterium]|nr:hypothetical protein [candidate division KSB1 bacterium]